MGAIQKALALVRRSLQAELDFARDIAELARQLRGEVHGREGGEVGTLSNDEIDRLR